MAADCTFDLEDRLLSCSARIIRFTESFPSTRAANHIAQQLLRSGTSSLARHGEAQAAKSPTDFIHKLRFCLKELRETRRWMLLARATVFEHASQPVDPLLLKTEELIKIFVASIATAQRNKLKQSHSQSSNTPQ